MKPLSFVRLGLDFTAAGLLLVALAYYWLNNAVHEIIGTGFFLLLIAHNLFNRRWWGGIPKGLNKAPNVVAMTMNLSLLITMLTLLVTSVIISQTVFSFLPIRSDVTSRQVHASAAYWALVIVAIHLGWQWRTVSAVVSTRLGITTASTLRTTVLRLLAVGLAAFGVLSWLELDIGSKLLMQMSLDGWDFATSTPAFFVHHLAVIGLFAFLAYYASMLIRGGTIFSPSVAKAKGTWVRACATGDIEEEDVIRFDHDGQSFAIYRSPENEYFATAGSARISPPASPTGWSGATPSSAPSTMGASITKQAKALGAPVIIPLKTYPVRVETARSSSTWADGVTASMVIIGAER